VVASLLAGACASTATVPEPAVVYTGQLDVHLEPFDDKGSCSITVGLRNSSGVRQGEANLQLAWIGSSGSLIAEQGLRMDGLLDGRYDAKNLALPVSCREVGRLVVRRAEWNLFDGWDTPARAVVRIEGAEGTEWEFGWDAQNSLFVGRRIGG
jgi:hypothetical protein